MKKLYKVPGHGKISGVCQGLSEYCNVDVTVVRLLWIVLAFISCGTAIFGYIACILIMPNKEDVINDNNNNFTKY